ncbi:cupin domain-containing protein [Dyella sp. 2RAB6]|uniref:cupin domain-containing protein n=1 Tax=Dyella sp. 2RAB6 TaxID=3232992 RepID=UPI003F8DB1AD
MLETTHLLKSFDRVTDYWSPKVIGRVNDQYLKVAKVKGELVWHAHAEEDELFLVIKGRLRIEFEGHAVDLDEGDMLTVPRGVRHNPVAEEECWVVLIEPVSTKHTGDVQTERTRTLEEQLR